MQTQIQRYDFVLNNREDFYLAPVRVARVFSFIKYSYTWGSSEYLELNSNQQKVCPFCGSGKQKDIVDFAKTAKQLSEVSRRACSRQHLHPLYRRCK